MESALKNKILENFNTVSLFLEENEVKQKESTEEELKDKFLSQFASHLLELSRSNVWSTFLNANLLLAKTLEIAELEGILSELKGKELVNSSFKPDFGKEGTLGANKETRNF